MARDATSGSPERTWEEVSRAGDETAFQKLVEPYLDQMLRLARRNLLFYAREGTIHLGDFSEEEIVGEALIHAWQHRDVKPPQMSVRSWLLGTEYRVMRGLVNQHRAYVKGQSISLDEPVPTHPDSDDKQEWFWDWYQPDETITWEDVIPAQEPRDIEVPLDEERMALLEDKEKRHVLLLHDEFEMDLPEVAFVLGRAPTAIAELLEGARATLRQQVSEEIDDTEHPAPPRAR